MVSPLRLLIVYNKAYGSLTAYPWMFAGRGRFVVDVIAPQDHVVKHSRWIQSWIPYENEDELHPTVSTALKDGNYAAMHVIDESSRNILLDHQDDPVLQPYLSFPVDSALHEIVRDKVAFHEWCVEEGISVPKSYKVTNYDEAHNAAVKLGYPCILKGAQGSRGSTVFLLDSDADLETSLAEYPNMENWLIQTYLKGPAGTTSIVAKNGKLFGLCSSYKTVTLDGGLGTSAVKQFVASEKLLSYAKRIAQVTRVSGATGFDWVEDGAGELYLIDPHFGRGPSSMMISHLDGVHIDKLLYDSLSGGTPSGTVLTGGTYVWIIPQCIHLLFEGRIKEAFTRARPTDVNVSIFWCGVGEWRMALRQFCPIILNRFRVLLGKWRREILG